MLNSEIDTTLEKPSPFPSVPVPTDGLAIDMIKKTNTLVVLGSNCLEYIPESPEDNPGIRTFGYHVTLHFENVQSKDAFKKNPHAMENALTIRRAAEEMMQDTLKVENQRDAGGHYGPPGDPALIDTINSGTYSDIEIVDQDLSALAQTTFPNAGISSVTIDDLTVQEGACPAPYDPSFADNMAAPPPAQIAVAGNGVNVRQHKR